MITQSKANRRLSWSVSDIASNSSDRISLHLRVLDFLVSLARALCTECDNSFRTTISSLSGILFCRVLERFTKFLPTTFLGLGLSLIVKTRLTFCTSAWTEEGYICRTNSGGGLYAYQPRQFCFMNKSY